MTISTEKTFWRRQDVLLGALLIVAGLSVNYVLEHHIFLKPGMLSPGGYLGSWPDVYLPSLAFLLTVSGAILLGFGLKRHISRGTSKWRFLPAFLVAILLTIPYCAFYLGMQFISTGADRLGECAGLVQAANGSHDVPDSQSFPGEPAVGCALERYGMFLSYYNDLAVFGVTDSSAQTRVLQDLSDYREKFHTRPMHVAFYEKQNVMPLRFDKQGKSWGWQAGPAQLLRLATLR
jgi:hypothetical protein